MHAALKTLYEFFLILEFKHLNEFSSKFIPPAFIIYVKDHRATNLLEPSRNITNKTCIC